MSESPVLAATAWRTNAEMVAEVARLYLNDDDRVIDLTYGEGGWWKVVRPNGQVAAWQGDFRQTPLPSDHFDVVCYDPPYVSVGGRATSTIKSFHARYGMDITPTTPAALQAEVIEPGLAEAHRIVRVGGLVWVKCQDYVSSGRLQPGTYWTTQYALARLGMELVDRIEHLSGVRPQPPGRRQVHARRNYSTLLILRRKRP